jgi:SnoaL-like domain
MDAASRARNPPRHMTNHPTPPIEDRMGIHDLFARYAWALDTGDVDGFLDAFTPDAEFLQVRAEGTRRYVGRDEIRGFAEELLAMPAFPGRQHHVDQLLFGPGEDGDRWRVRSYAFVTEVHAGEPIGLAFAGHYDDVCVRTDGGAWLLERRAYSRWEGDVLRRFR